MDPDGQVGGPYGARPEADGRTAGQLAMGLRHERGRTLVAGRHDPDPGTLEGVEQAQEGLTGNGEGVPDAGAAERVRDEAADGVGPIIRRRGRGSSSDSGASAARSGSSAASSGSSAASSGSARRGSGASVAVIGAPARQLRPRPRRLGIGRCDSGASGLALRRRGFGSLRCIVHRLADAGSGSGPRQTVSGRRAWSGRRARSWRRRSFIDGWWVVIVSGSSRTAMARARRARAAGR